MSKLIKFQLKLKDGVSIDCVGYVPYEGSPLALTRPLFQGTAGIEFDESQWCVRHVRTSMSLGRTRFKTRKAGLAFIDALKPREWCWIVCDESKGKECPEMVRCFELYQEAVKASVS
jgi:hypothetical protein